MTNNPPFLSIVIPVYNESKRLYNLETIIGFIQQQPFKVELLIVNDGSTDQTLKLLKNYQNKHSFILISYLTNRGKGYALKQGMLKATGDNILFTDLDLSTPLSEFNKLIKHLEKYNVVIGTRKTGSSKLVKRQPIIRETLGKCFTLLSQVVLNLYLSDFTCGFKCFKRKAAKEIFSKSIIDRWGFDSEILFITNKLGLKIKEIPVKWKNDPQTKVKFPEDIFNSLYELYRIRINDLQGRYKI